MYLSIIFGFVLEENMQQLNEHATREMYYNGVLKTSNLDHIYTNTPELIKNISAEQLSTSDHKILKFRKHIKMKDQKPDCTRRRVYSNMDIGKFLSEVNDSQFQQRILKDIR